MTTDNLIPDGWRTIAVRDDRQGKCVISFNRDTKTFYFSVNGSAAGPFNEKDLRQLMENIRDVLSMKGNFLYISEYDTMGNKEV